MINIGVDHDLIGLGAEGFDLLQGIKFNLGGAYDAVSSSHYREYMFNPDAVCFEGIAR